MEISLRAHVAVVMGSQSDWEVMQEATNILQTFEVPFWVDIVSAHRTPHKMFQFAQNAAKNGLKVIIAGAGGAAHLPGMIASLTTLPVIGVPIKSSNSIDGWDSVLSILQMPNGVPVATVALNAAQNAGLLAIQILAIADNDLALKLTDYKQKLQEKVHEQSQKIRAFFYS
ncbi:MAG: 5-(carboxyamino)imidazole ribonucleotide mutase [Microscillaceae bacterium]|nr:5-(carboxyamino)imidazole ribonucleotide mutase [Microscillaceae bacterium]MDW8460080.1 5-(carboxyamino)imidazole ribonucleotide mutase [Cytophagales bacterium]